MRIFFGFYGFSKLDLYEMAFSVFFVQSISFYIMENTYYYRQNTFAIVCQNV